jgi:transposase, IS6 family
MSIFKRRRFPVEIILLCVRWYCKYGISYRDLAEMMSERGVAVDPSTIFRWVQRYAPEIEKRVRQYQGPRSGSWRVDETYVRVGGKWKYLFRAVDKHGQLIDFMLSDRRNTRAAYRFLRKALKTMSDYPPSSITTDKLASYPNAIRRLQIKGLLSKDAEHRTSKYLNNVIEADHGALKRVIRPTRGFQRMKTASATLRGFEVMRMIRRGHCMLPVAGVIGEIRLVNQLFGLAARAASSRRFVVLLSSYCNSATDIAIDVVSGKQEDLGLVSHDCIPDRLRLLLIGTGAESNPH